MVVPLAGLEPARSFERGILSPLRLPIPPQRHLLEAPPGFEPGNKGFADLGLTTWLWRHNLLSWIIYGIIRALSL